MGELNWFEEPILAIETSCDETSAAVTLGRRVLSNVVSSQVALHEKWGGVVPEAAARAHVEVILPVLQEALNLADVGLPQISAIAVTNRPGLVGALSVGLTAAKGLSLSLGLPMIGIHHLEGHLLSPFAVTDAEADNHPSFPHLCLIVSGGHTELVLVETFGKYHIVGQTLDDAAGEAFDKGARLLGLGYPGGKAIQEAAAQGDPSRYSLPIGIPDEPYNFSFSGLKTAVLRLCEKEGDQIVIQDAAASLQKAIVDALAQKSVSAIEAHHVGALSLVGGVAANLSLRERLTLECARMGVSFHAPAFDLCTDNAAMIGIAASWRLAMGYQDDESLDVFSNAPLGGCPNNLIRDGLLDANR